MHLLYMSNIRLSYLLERDMEESPLLKLVIYKRNDLLLMMLARKLKYGFEGMVIIGLSCNQYDLFKNYILSILSNYLPKLRAFGENKISYYSNNISSMKE